MRIELCLRSICLKLIIIHIREKLKIHKYNNLQSSGDTREDNLPRAKMDLSRPFKLPPIHFVQLP